MANSCASPSILGQRRIDFKDPKQPQEPLAIVTVTTSLFSALTPYASSTQLTADI